MTLVISILNSLGLVGLGIFIYFLFHGLQKRIDNLKLLAEEQKQTLEAVRERADEFDRLSKSYKQALADFQEMGEKLEARRKQLIKELEDESIQKDAEIVKLKELELQELEIKKKSYDRLPELEEKLQSLVADLSRQMEIIAPDRGLLGFTSQRQKPRGFFSFLGDEEELDERTLRRVISVLRKHWDSNDDDDDDGKGW